MDAGSLFLAAIPQGRRQNEKKDINIDSKYKEKSYGITSDNWTYGYKSNV